jgi:hypothetical protein
MRKAEKRGHFGIFLKLEKGERKKITNFRLAENGRN